MERKDCSTCKYYDALKGYCKKNKHHIEDCSWCVCYKPKNIAIKVNMEISLDIIGDGKTNEETKNFAYYLVEPFLEQFVEDNRLITDGFTINSFEINIKD